MEPRPVKSVLIMTVPEAGARLGLSPKASYDAALRGMFPVVRNGRRKYVPIKAFENWLAGAGLNPTWPQKGSGEDLTPAARHY